MTAEAQTYQELFMPTPAGFTSLWQSIRKTLSEEGIIDGVSKLSPWIAPLPSAWFVHDATVRHLNAGSGLAWVIAIVTLALALLVGCPLGAAKAQQSPLPQPTPSISEPPTLLHLVYLPIVASGQEVKVVVSWCPTCRY